ncbi:MAG: epoxyqueuosine reductase [Rhodothalassiaceae bacterium]|nr:MAG: epoxyqueuosine reductase [Rhodothalassiaceae bacterium]
MTPAVADRGREAKAALAPEAIRARLLAAARELGFAAAGIVAADALAREGAGARLEEWLRRGCHGEMAWMAARAEERADPRRYWPPVKSILMLGFSYAPAGDPLAATTRGREAAISVYARRKDYHKVVGGRLRRLKRVAEELGLTARIAVDTAPLMEKPLARLAGIGWQGKHSNLVSRRHGSWLFLGALLLDRPLPADEPHADHCGRCRRCLDACPTDAFPAPYVLDARRCISYLTIENRGPIPRALRPLIGNRVFGCDDCLAVCPWNKFAAAARETALALRPQLAGLPLADLLALEASDFDALFAGTPVRRAGHHGFLRNLLVAAGNSGDPALAQAVRPHLAHPEPLVRLHAVWAYGRLADAASWRVARRRGEAAETDPAVRAEWAETAAERRIGHQ